MPRLLLNDEHWSKLREILLHKAIYNKAQQCQGRCGEVQAIATAATGLACFIFRFLRRPPDGRARLAAHRPAGA